ncbi:hypothetical protein AVEN_256811-1 [Araneus ventricosus]|uniref:Uncharacterized protein n=1 Tax=Araneus ventricosus TaxID=182803 RepID=A0A4Y2VGW4_ARAVE|nr:hypothetical protein AVEN_256811-1 [Araneus ventricosus]
MVLAPIRSFLELHPYCGEPAEVISQLSRHQPAGVVSALIRRLSLKPLGLEECDAVAWLKSLGCVVGRSWARVLVPTNLMYQFDRRYVWLEFKPVLDGVLWRLGRWAVV